MKKLIITIMAIVAVATSFTSCQKDEERVFTHEELEKAYDMKLHISLSAEQKTMVRDWVADIMRLEHGADKHLAQADPKLYEKYINNECTTYDLLNIAYFYYQQNWYGDVIAENDSYDFCAFLMLEALNINH